MNAQAYKGIRKYQTPAFRADRAIFDMLGAKGYEQYRAERVDYYRSLIRKVRESK